ncbi:hypothetical protein BD309DRAFT_1023166 [Dichomitus squalens]|nr:hypothetical protein BD309DRAFT_1023166 [Dichomitus squalens]
MLPERYFVYVCVHLPPRDPEAFETAHIHGGNHSFTHSFDSFNFYFSHVDNIRLRSLYRGVKFNFVNNSSQAVDEQRIALASTKVQARQEYDRVVQKTVDFQVWVEPLTRPFHICEFIESHPLLTLATIRIILERFPSGTKAVALYNRMKGRWQEREVNHPIALQEGEREVFIRAVGLSDAQCLDLPLSLAPSSTLKRSRSPTLVSAVSPTKRVKSVSITDSLLPLISAATFSPPSPSLTSPSPGWSIPTPSNVSPASLEQSYAGLLGALTFTSLTVAQRAAAFPSKYSFAEVAAFIRAVDEEAKKEELSIGKALDCIVASTGVRCGTTNLNAVRMNLKRGNYELWREFIDASPTRLGSYSQYKNRVKKLPPVSSLDWTSFPQEQKPVSTGPILVPADDAAPASMMGLPFQFTFMHPIPMDFPADAALFIDD